MTAESPTNPVRYDALGEVAVVKLARPPVNALDLAAVRSLIAALNRAAADENVRAVILASAVPKRFCAGLDIGGLIGKSPDNIRTLVHELYVGLSEAQYHLGKPSIAAVNGAARGGGMTLAVSCDVVIAAETATFGYPEIDLGVLPAIHFIHLPRVIGRHRAFELLFTGRGFDAIEAAGLGIINRVVPGGELESEALKLARHLATKPANAVRRGRAAFMRQIDLDYRRSIANAVEDFANIAATEEAQAGFRAFAQKQRSK
jgi:enoyl-CoA hydratase/carnithine racemase